MAQSTRSVNQAHEWDWKVEFLQLKARDPKNVRLYKFDEFRNHFGGDEVNPKQSIEDEAFGIRDRITNIKAEIKPTTGGKKPDNPFTKTELNNLAKR